MPRETASETTRRTMLRAVGAGAGAGLLAFGAGGNVAARGDADGSNIDVSPDCECYYEYRCDTDLLCENPSTDYPYYHEYRECCECDEGTTCDNWTYNGCCYG